MAGNQNYFIPTKRKKKKKKKKLQEEEEIMGDLYALDFDGVLCDSCGESSLSAVKVQNSLSLSLSLTKILCLFPEKSDTINFDHVLFFSYLCCFFF